MPPAGSASHLKTAAAIALALLALSATPPAPAIARARAAGLCRAGETPLYSCRFRGGTGSICLSRAAIHYRYGAPGRPSVDVSNSPSWDNVHVDTVVGQVGGHQSHIRFTAGPYDYVVYEGQAGEATDVPGKRYSGIVVLRAGKEIARLDCARRPLLREDWTDRLVSAVPASAKDRVYTEEERYREWF